MTSPFQPPSLKSPQLTTERDIDELQTLLDAIPAPLESLDVSSLDGFLCGLLVQPIRAPAARWLPYITDVDARALPSGHDATRLHELTLRRHAELDHAIAQRKWFDPWVFELGESDGVTEAVYPWVAGFATALEVFPALMQQDSPQALEPLALLYRHLDPDDLEDADALLEEIESLEPPSTLTDGVEELVRATLLLADVGRPVPVRPVRPTRAPAGGRARRR